MQTVKKKKKAVCFLKVIDHVFALLYHLIVNSMQHIIPEVCVETLLWHFSEITDVYIYIP